MKFIAAACLGLLFIASCDKPKVCLSSSATTVGVGEKIEFTDCSQDVSEYSIDYKDGMGRTIKPIYLGVYYTVAGTYTVEYRVNVEEGGPGTELLHEEKITVEHPSEADLVGTWTKLKTDNYNLGNSNPYRGETGHMNFTARANSSTGATNETLVLSASGMMTDGTWSVNESELVLDYGDTTLGGTVVRMTKSALIFRHMHPTDTNLLYLEHYYK